MQSKRPCVKCGTEFEGKRCKNCRRIRDALKKEENYQAKLDSAARKIANATPCKKCGTSNWNKSGGCRTCRIVYSAENKAKLDAKAKAYRDANREELNAKARAYTDANRVAINARRREAYTPEKAKVKRLKNYDKEKKKIYAKRYYDKNADKCRARSKERKYRFPKETKESISKWRQENRHVCAVHDASRRASKLNATPVWGDTFLIKEIYHLAKLRTKATGIVWTVDHIVPLISTLVCGLHWEGNMQVITKSENSRKSNHYWTDMP